MDPKVTLELFVDAILYGRHNEAKEHYWNLKNWIDRGGFEPDWHEGKKKIFENFDPNTGLVRI
jgi:hypothetical protein